MYVKQSVNIVCNLHNYGVAMLFRYSVMWYGIILFDI